LVLPGQGKREDSEASRTSISTSWLQAEGALLRAQMMVKKLISYDVVCLHYQAVAPLLPPPPGDFRDAGFHVLMLFFVVFNLAGEVISQVAKGLPMPPPALPTPAQAGLPIPPAAPPKEKEATTLMLVQVGFVSFWQANPSPHIARQKMIWRPSRHLHRWQPHIVSRVVFSVETFHVVTRCQQVGCLHGCHLSHQHNMELLVERAQFGPHCFNVSYFVLGVPDEPMFSIRLDAPMGTSSWKPIPQNLCFEFLVIECL